MSTQVSNFGVSPKMIERLALSGIRGLNKYLFAVFSRILAGSIRTRGKPLRLHISPTPGFGREFSVSPFGETLERACDYPGLRPGLSSISPVRGFERKPRVQPSIDRT